MQQTETGDLLMTGGINWSWIERHTVLRGTTNENWAPRNGKPNEGPTKWQTLRMVDQNVTVSAFDCWLGHLTYYLITSGEKPKKFGQGHIKWVGQTEIIVDLDLFSRVYTTNPHNTDWQTPGTSITIVCISCIRCSVIIYSFLSCHMAITSEVVKTIPEMTYDI